MHFDSFWVAWKITNLPAWKIMIIYLVFGDVYTVDSFKVFFF